MIGSTRQVAVFAFGGPIDMRKGFDGLAAVVTQNLGRDPLSGDVFLFVNRTRKRAKVLLWDGTGLCIYANQPPSHYTSFDARRGPWSRVRDAQSTSARSLRRSQRLQCFVG